MDLNLATPNESNCPVTVTKYYTATTINEQTAPNGLLTSYDPSPTKAKWTLTFAGTSGVTLRRHGLVSGSDDNEHEGVAVV